MSAIETALTELSANLRRMEQRHQATGYKFDRLYGLIDAARGELAQLTHAGSEDAIRELIAKHREELDHNSYAYFELAHTRQTGWCAWITDHPRSMPPMPTVNPDRKVIANGQGDTPEEACRAALGAMRAAS